MTFLTEVKTLLDLLGTLGTLTIGYMPASPDAIGTVYCYGGIAPDRQFGLVGAGYENPAIQVVFRGDPYDYAGPEAKAQAALVALISVQPGALCSGVTTEYLTLDPQQNPFPVAPIDESHRHRIGFNVYVKKSPSS